MSIQEKPAPVATPTETEHNRFVLGTPTSLTGKRIKRQGFSFETLAEHLTTLHILTAKNRGKMILSGDVVSTSASKTIENTRDVQMVTADIDNKDLKPDDPQHYSYEQACKDLEAFGCNALIETTFSHKAPEYNSVDKFRIQLPMLEPYTFDADKDKQKEFWEERLHTAMVVSVIGARPDAMDKSSGQIARAFFTHSCPKDREEKARSRVFDTGKYLDWQDYVQDAMAQKIQALSEIEETKYVFNEIDLVQWDAIYGSTFDIWKAVEATNSKAIGKTVDSGKARTLAECPFIDEHESAQGKTKTVIYNPDGKGSKFGFDCKGEGCTFSDGTRRPRLEYLQKMLEDGTIIEAQIFDPALGGGGLDAMKMAKRCKKKTSTERIRHILKVAEYQDNTALMIDVRAKLKQKTKRSISEIKELLSDVRDERHETLGKSETSFEKQQDTNVVKQLNPHFAIVIEGGKVRILKKNTGKLTLMHKTDFELWIAHIAVRRPNTAIDAASKIFIQSPDAERYENVVFRPYGYGKSDPTPANKYNLYQGLAVEPKKGDWSRLQSHILQNVCHGNETEYEWFIGWLAHMIMEPEVKPESCVVLHGKKGTGKSKISYWVRRMFKRQNGIKINGVDRISAKFNSVMMYALFVMGEEITWGGLKSANNKFKDMVSGDTIEIEGKGLEVKDVESFMRFILTGNDAWIVAATEDERRFYVQIMSEAFMQNGKYFAAIDEQMNNGGLEAMLYDLIHFDYKAKGIDVRNPPKTAALAGQVQEAFDNEDKWFSQVLHKGHFGEGLMYKDNTPKEGLNWDKNTWINKEEVYETYLAFCKEQKDRSHIQYQQFSTWLLDKRGVKIDNKGRHPNIKRGYKFNPLFDLREKYAERTGLAFEDEKEVT